MKMIKNILKREPKPTVLEQLATLGKRGKADATDRAPGDYSLPSITMEGPSK